MTDRLPALIDRKGIIEEMQVTRATADAILRHVHPVVIPGLRKTVVRRADVLALVDEWTWRDDGSSVRPGLRRVS